MEEKYPSCAGHGYPDDCTSHTATKRPEQKLLHLDRKDSELHDLLSHCHRADGEGIHMSVDDILKVEG